MRVIFKAVHAPRRIEYLRNVFESEQYLPAGAEILEPPTVGGKLWHDLGVEEVTMPILRKLAAGINPSSGDRLTARNNAANGGRRTSYTSVIFAAPKSCSIVGEIAGDARIRSAVKSIADEILAEMEDEFAGFRVRDKHAPDYNRVRRTQSLAWVARLENDSRHADPHIHVHAEIFNVTRDATGPDRRFRALELHPFFAAQKVLSARFDDRLKRRLAEMGYGVGTLSIPEIEGVPGALVDRFSRGRNAVRRRLGEEPPACASRWARENAIESAERRSRPSKIYRSQEQLRSQWLRRLTPRELSDLIRIRLAANGIPNPFDLRANVPPNPCLHDAVMEQTLRQVEVR